MKSKHNFATEAKKESSRGRSKSTRGRSKSSSLIRSPQELYTERFQYVNQLSNDKDPNMCSQINLATVLLAEAESSDNTRNNQIWKGTLLLTFIEEGKSQCMKYKTLESEGCSSTKISAYPSIYQYRNNPHRRPRGSRKITDGLKTKGAKKAQQIDLDDEEEFEPEVLTAHPVSSSYDLAIASPEPKVKRHFSELKWSN